MLRDNKSLYNKKSNKILCFLLALFLLLAGINIDAIQIDASYSNRALVNSSNMLITLGAGGSSEAEVCTQEMLGIQESVFVGNTTRRVLNRRSTKNAFSLILAVLFRQFFLKRYMTSVNVNFYYVPCHTIILNYIHNQDGKK